MTLKPKHECRAAGCDRAREEWALTCRECWHKVPKDLQTKLFEAGPAGSVERGLAAYAVISHLAGAQEELEL